MTTPRSIDDIMNEMNDLAKAHGRYLGKTFWEVPPQPGSILEVPETPESRERVARLRERRLARKHAAAPKGEGPEQVQDGPQAAPPGQPPAENAGARE